MVGEESVEKVHRVPVFHGCHEVRESCQALLGTDVYVWPDHVLRLILKQRGTQIMVGVNEVTCRYLGNSGPSHGKLYINHATRRIAQHQVQAGSPPAEALDRLEYADN